ncbi:aldo/keto reductase, partial [bacterium]
MMQHLTLPKTNLNVSNLCLGTADFGAGIDEKTSFALLDQFVAAGGNFLDTAAIYADWTPAGKGSSEKLLGKWLKERDGEVVIATKGAHPEIATMDVSRMAQPQVQADLEHSLENLGVEAIDLYYLHRDDTNIPVAQILEMLEGFVTAGKIRHYGCSNWSVTRLQEAIDIAAAKGITGFVASQPMWSLAEIDLKQGDSTLVAIDEAYRAWHAKTGFPAIPYSSQANGYFN